MFTDLKDGRKLLDLLEGLTGTSLVRGVFFENQTNGVSLIISDLKTLGGTYSVRAQIGTF